jgi:UDP-N-acetylglucosamine:LPS N-acetylglucosamine transferase
LEGEKLFLTCLWRDEETEGDIVGVDPLAQEGDGESVEQYDVLLILGTFGDKFEELGSMLAEDGLEVKIVGGDDWETKKSMTPYTEAADCVVCAGFSSIADAVVPGTPTVVFPKLHMQELLARQIDEKGVKGVETAYSVEEAYEQVQRVLDGKVSAPEFENGASRVVDVVLDS